ncbi:MAG: hypothetical protein M3O61_07110 [Gemmatimonadota bacterium]|nr:hypothetical protein [Gemmatimonadota bacterium]
MTRFSDHDELLKRVTEQLAGTPSSTDHAMILRWRVVSLCQYLLTCSDPKLAIICIQALEIFAADGVAKTTDDALRAARQHLKHVLRNDGLLPSFSSEKCADVRQSLETLAAPRSAIIPVARGFLPEVSARVKQQSERFRFPGLSHRFGMLKAVVTSDGRSEADLVRAAAAVLYVKEMNDVVPDALGLLGLLDDDYALRVVLDDLQETRMGQHLHWSERISVLWDDLPFLQGVNLQRNDEPVFVSWLDRVNSFLTYSHVLQADETPLVLIQPAIACLPLHSLISLIGLGVLEAFTSSRTKAYELKVGQLYEVDGCIVRFEGIGGSREPEWPRLGLRGCSVYQPPGIADRMIPIDRGRLSSQREFASRARSPGPDALQKFFDWDTALGAASLSRPLVLVSSQRDAQHLLGGVRSNGVSILDHGLVRFATTTNEIVDTRGTVVVVAPSLSVVRKLLQSGIELQGVLVDGYDRLQSGRHDLPFLLNAQPALPIIVWATGGYYPDVVPGWMPPHRCLEASVQDVEEILKLDDPQSGELHQALWESATGVQVQQAYSELTEAESTSLSAIDRYLDLLNDSHIPDYWRYFLRRGAREIRLLLTATPARSVDTTAFVNAWIESIAQPVSLLRSEAAAAQLTLRTAEMAIADAIQKTAEPLNSRARSLKKFITQNSPKHWKFVCKLPSQIQAINSVVRTERFEGTEPVLLRDLSPNMDCLTAGWTGRSFAKRLFAHTPSSVVALVDDNEFALWNSAIQKRPLGSGFLADVRAANVVIAAETQLPRRTIADVPDRNAPRDADVSERVRCVFLRPSGELRAKVLPRESGVVVNEQQGIRERTASRLRAGDHVILGLANSRWSPADEFTEALVDIVRSLEPQVVATAMEWRRALRQYQLSQGLSAVRLRERLASAGVTRELATIEGWLDTPRAAPIAPRQPRRDLAAIWSIAGEYAQHSPIDVLASCLRLRRLRLAAGRALLNRWLGRHVDLGVDEAWVDSLVDDLRNSVSVYEVETVTEGIAPIEMMGWWIPSEFVARFRSGELSDYDTAFSEAEDAIDASAT